MHKAESRGLGSQQSLVLFVPKVRCEEKSLEGVGENSIVGHLWILLSLSLSTSAFTALADNHISHNSSLGYLGAVESKVAYPAPPQVPPTRYSPIPRHMLAEEDFTR